MNLKRSDMFHVELHMETVRTTSVRSSRAASSGSRAHGGPKGKVQHISPPGLDTRLRTATVAAPNYGTFLCKSFMRRSHANESVC